MWLTRPPFVLSAALALGLAWALRISPAAGPPAKGPTDSQLRKRPVTTAPGEVGNLLRAWYKGGTAAGNVGDSYDNRDGGHSDLDLSSFPQLRKVRYTPEDVRLRRHWALQTVVLPHVVFGNSSTSAPPLLGGSNPRTYYCHPRGLPFLYQQYTHNNLYVYPEHRDHDPGHNGQPDGFGDLYPANTPYLLISQGSSGSDQPFLRAIPFTLAALRPEVKKKLAEKGLLMPTVQMILRSTNTHLADPGEYLTGKAHPTAFEGAWVDPLKMARLAHSLRAASTPPFVRIKVVEETRADAGKDFFEPPGLTEQHADTPAAVARIWRGHARRRRLVVSAEDSSDLNKRPLTYRWVVLRGDPGKVRIKPRNKERSVAEVVVDYHPRRPIAPGAALESNRVDVGVFVHNGWHYSAPAFLTFFSLDGEARAYDAEGRTLEVGYGMGEVLFTAPDHAALWKAASDKLPGRLLKLSAVRRLALLKAREEYLPLARALATLRERHAALVKARPPAGRDLLQKAEAGLRDAEKRLNDFLDRKRDDLKDSPRAFLDRALQSAAADPGLYNDHAEDLAPLLAKAPPARRAAVEAARRRLVTMGLAKPGGTKLAFTPVRGGSAPLAERLTPFEKMLLARFHAAVLTELVFPGVLSHAFQVNYVDHRLSAPKDWRDVYHHDRRGRLLGWTRYGGDRPVDFTADGLAVREKDDRGRPTKVRTVVYRQAPPASRFGPNTNPLQQEEGDEVVTFEYDGDKVRVKRHKAEGK